MARPLSLADLPDDVARFAEAQLASGRFSTVEEVIRAGAEALRQREDEAKLASLRTALEEGERSGRSDYSLEKVLAELDAETAHGRTRWPQVPRNQAPLGGSSADQLR